MIDALIHGRLIHFHEEGVHLMGRIVLDDDTPVQFAARRGAVKRQLAKLPLGAPLSVAGRLTTGVRRDKQGAPYVSYELTVSAVLTAQPAGLLAGIL